VPGRADVTKNDLVRAVSAATGVTQSDTHRVINAFVDGLKGALASHQTIALRGFGTFTARKRGAMVARNPQTGEKIPVPPNYYAAFRPYNELQDAVRREGVTEDDDE